MPEKMNFKKTDKLFYMPGLKPSVVEVPEMLFIEVAGTGDPNTSAAYKNAMEILYGLSYGIKMSKMDGSQPEGYFEYVVPPLEGLWRMADGGAVDYSRKAEFEWISMIRQPSFVTEAVFEQAKEKLHRKKPELALSGARLTRRREGLCVQVMHRGPYDDEPATLQRLMQFMAENGFVPDYSDERRHHEIYLGDPRKTVPEKLRTVLRLPVRKI